MGSTVLCSAVGNLRRYSSPNSADGKLVENFVVAQNRQVFDLGLRSERAIERILVGKLEESGAEAWAVETGSSRKPLSSITDRKRETNASAASSFPALNFMAISHAEAAETRTRTDGSATKFLTGAGS